MKNALIFSVSLAAGLVSSTFADPIVEIDGQITDKTSGWTFKASKPNQKGMTFNEFEGYYPDKGGKLFSRKIKLPKKSGTPAYYRLTFEAQAPERADGKGAARM